MESFFKDLRLGARVLVRSPLALLWLILTLALGIGANIAMFSVVDALLLHPVVYKDPGNLVVLWERDQQGVKNGFSAADFSDLRARSRSFTSIAGWTQTSYVMTGLDRAQRVSGAAVSDNFFSTLGLTPVLGRAFGPGEDGIERPGAAAQVAMISYGFWQTAFGGSRSVLQRQIQLDGVSYTVIGVLPAEFNFYGRRPANVYIPIGVDRSDRDYHYLVTVARLGTPGSSASAEMRALANALASEYPLNDKGWTIELQDLLEWAVDRQFRLRVLLLSGGVFVVLLITCTNVAGLLLTRAVSRAREMAVRVALGASKARLVRQLFTENLLLTGTGVALGLALAAALIRAVPSLAPANILATAMPIRLNLAVMSFTVGIAIAVSILFGLVPAFSAARVHVMDALKSGGRGTTDGIGAQRFRQALVVLQLALALVLLSTGVLMSQSLGNMMRVNPGFDMKDVFAMPVYLPPSRYDAARQASFHQDLLTRVAALGGVEAAALGTTLPLYDISLTVPFDVEDAAPRPISERPGVAYVTVSPTYFESLRIPLLGGRSFTVDDRESLVPVVIVNQAFAQRYFRGRDPVGQRISLNRPIFGKNAFDAAVRPQVVGVVGNVRLGMNAPESEPILYAPLAQNVWSATFWLVARASGNPRAVVEQLRSVIGSMGNDVTPSQITILADRYQNRFSGAKFQTALIAGFAVLSLILAVIGIYGVTSHFVVQRHAEIGLRMALGATPAGIVGEVLSSGVGLALVGVGIGLGSAALAGLFLRNVLVGISPTDPAALFVAAGGLFLVSLVAVLIPALRATLVEPSTVLRQD